MNYYYLLMKKLITGVFIGAFSCVVTAQTDGPSITGNVESVFQYLQEDSIIQANQPAEIGLLNSYMNVFYTQGNFKAGLRVESYLPRIQGYPANFDGTGIGMRYVGYANDFIDVTLGSFYEQFGSGLSFRAYEDRTLGYDNMMDGARVILRPLNGVTVKGVYGLQRYKFIGGRIVHGDGVVRGFDGEANLNQLIPALKDKKLNVTVGGSFVSKYQAQGSDLDSIFIPENVGCYGGRINFRYGKFTLGGEYVIKEADPSSDQNAAFDRVYFDEGHAAVVNFGYSKKGLGIMLSAKSVDNMSYRSDRNEGGQNLFINFLPAMNKVHTYNLVSSLYPWATQPLGEIAYQGEVLYTIKRGSKLGGKYGTTLNLNSSIAMRPLQSKMDYFDSSGVYYTSAPFSTASLGHNADATAAELYSIYGHADSTAGKYFEHRNFFWQDINFNIYRKFSKKFNMKLSYFNIMMNNDVNKVTGFAHGTIISNIGVVEVGYKLNRKHSFRFELQGLFINRIKEYEDGHLIERPNDKGDWVTAVFEYNFSPHWFFSVMDQWNLPNDYLDNIYTNSALLSNFEPEKTGVHHPYVSAGYIRGATRITAGYGRQRAGLFCVGGICRNVPASNGLTLSITHSF